MKPHICIDAKRLSTVRLYMRRVLDVLEQGQQA